MLDVMSLKGEYYELHVGHETYQLCDEKAHRKAFVEQPETESGLGGPV
jgi:hypothetical protein